MSQAEILATGRAIFAAMQGQKASVFDKNWWTGKMMAWAMQNPEFKVAMFRFVDVLPYLQSSEQIGTHLKEYFLADGQEVPPIFEWGIGAVAATSIGSRIAGAAIKKNVEQMARRFIVGTDPHDALTTLKEITDKGYAFTVDVLGEAALSETEAQHYQTIYLELMRVLHQTVTTWPAAQKIRQPLNVSVKLSSIYSQLDPAAFDESVAQVTQRLLPIFKLAQELGIFINLDMESYAYKNITLAAFRSVLVQPELREFNLAGIAIQAYLRDAEHDVAELLAWAQAQKRRITVRLVKGAYWDYEVLTAAQKNWPCPVFIHKIETDASFERITTLLLRHNNDIGCAVGSHNVRSIAHAIVTAKELRLSANDFEFQALYNMAEPIKQVLLQMGYQVREYSPVGALIPGMAYLVRRLLENTSNESFLRQSFVDEKSVEELLREPSTTGLDSRLGRRGGFVNTPPADFGVDTVRTAFAHALQNMRKSGDDYYPLRIGGKSVKTSKRATSINPAFPDQSVGHYALASIDNATAAIRAAETAFSEWHTTPVPKRTAVLRKAADLMEQQRFDLAALQVLEVGKPWSEADADVCEAIDFLRYYAKEMERLAIPQTQGSVPGERNVYHYSPKGVGVVIAPWNFPLAISTGMVAAGIVTGNTVIYKPSEQASITGAKLVQILEAAGLPAGVVNFLPGSGAVVGKYLAEHPAIKFITFTGSREVGLQLIQHSNQFSAGQHHVKRIVAEMGGKNAIIVDADADLDEAVSGVVKSAFGYAGQKCSACSRVIVLAENYDRFLTRLIDAAASIAVGDPQHPHTLVGPVIDVAAQTKIQAAIIQGQRDARLVYQGTAPTSGYFIPPTIFADVQPQHALAQEEIFGPVLAVMKVATFAEAIHIANGTPYALTGGVYSRSPANIAYAEQNFEVGNLYINRPCTGAIVNRHPFGGYKLSGVGSKAGGPDYLLQFLEPRSISENTMRRGFAPDIFTMTLGES